MTTEQWHRRNAHKSIHAPNRPVPHTPQQGSAAGFSAVHTEQGQSSLNAIVVLSFAVEALARGGASGSEGIEVGMSGAAVDTLVGTNASAQERCKYECHHSIET